MISPTITDLVLDHLMNAQCLPVTFDGKQKRLQGRAALIPTLNWNDYRFKAGFDTAVVQCRFTTRKHPVSLQATLENALGLTGIYIDQKMIDDTSQLCYVTLQNPSINNLRALENLPEIDGAVILRQLDIAVDLHPSKTMDDVTRYKACRDAKDALARHILFDPDWAPMGFNPRWTGNSPIVGSKKRYTTIGRKAYEQGRLIQTPNHTEGTFYLTHKDAPIECRIYHKTKDRLGSINEKSIPVCKQIARHEIILYSDALERLALTTIADLENFKFETLSTFATFRAPTVKQWTGHPPLNKQVAQRLGTATAMRLLNGGMGLVMEGTRKSSRSKWGHTVALSDLNKRMAVAFAHLGEKVSRGYGATRI